MTTSPADRPVRAVATARRQPLLIANDFYFLAHDDRTGQPRLFPAALSLGLAAGLLMELHYAGRISFSQGAVHVWRDGPTPVDWLQHKILDRMLTEPQNTPVRQWLSYLAASAGDQVAQRMTQAGLLREQTTGPWWRRRTVYVPTDINTAAWPWARLSQQLRNRRGLPEHDVLLAGLAAHTQLDVALLDGASWLARDYLSLLVEHLFPPWPGLLGELGAAVGAAVLSHRTS
ncbi:GPP34 family phosphoprotein [Micromonospora sp. HUAS LYJ1]|uniref:GOLPH3/VPS74 family protein n=1 Tax=Micromonospora sp. HUAS LYJ1 TaxID=3061626 RepID=UPI0026710B2D|nr:GPP34 family phosphoprotein [Micromonospora sp. HUAS LYJ1]WKU03784.1 GPP34 family phosphoprotein [Micromonospora sp. HUAS LYJ1]